MTKKDYIVIAEAIVSYAVVSEIESKDYDILVGCFKEKLVADNPKFDSLKFMDYLNRIFVKYELANK